MWKYLLIISIASLFLFGCAEAEIDETSDDESSVTLNLGSSFKAGSFAIGCFIVDDSGASGIQCLCSEGGTEYTGTASGSTYCQQWATDVTFVADGTKISDPAVGDHYYCSTTDTSTDGDMNTACQSSGDANTSTATIEADTTYSITFTGAGSSGRSIE